MNPTPTEQMANVYAAFEETEEYYEHAGEVVRLAREWLISKKSLSAAYRDRHGVLSDICQQRRANMHKLEDALDAAVETLERWLKLKGRDVDTLVAEAAAPDAGAEKKEGEYGLG